MTQYLLYRILSDNDQNDSADVNNQFQSEILYHMKNQTILITISFLSIFMTFISTAIIVTEVILGYSGFKQINGKSSVITLQQDCQLKYYDHRYNQALDISLKICFVCTLVSFVFANLAFLMIMCFIHGCRKYESNQREQTRIQEIQQHFYQNNHRSQYYYPKMSEITALYVFLTLIVITSSIPFNFYLQTIVQARKGQCLINYQETQIFSLALLNLILLCISLISLIILMVISYRYHKRMDMLQMQNGSESYRQQINRIMQEIPESQRRFYQNQGKMESLGKGQHQNTERPHEIMIRQSSFNNKQSMKIEQVPRVKSIIYKADPQLMLESINIYNK